MATTSPTFPSPVQFAWLKRAIFVLALVPFARMVYLTVTGQLVEPLEFITRGTGDWVLYFLCITLAVTPLRRLSKWNWLLKLRRMLGLYAFFYACLHLGVFLWLDLRGYWMQVFEDITKRPYITVGFLAWLLLVPLAVTSTTGWIKRLGRNWARLHKLVYVIAVLAVLHFWWLVKSDIREPALYAGIAALLLGWRAWKVLRTRATARAKARTVPPARA